MECCHPADSGCISALAENLATNPLLGTNPPRASLNNNVSNSQTCVHDLVWPRPSLATTFFGHDLLWPRPTLATTYFGHDLLWPRPTLATTFFGQADFGHGLSDFGDNLKLADLGRFWSGQTDLGQLWPPALPWPIWAMALQCFWWPARSWGRFGPTFAGAVECSSWQPNFHKCCREKEARWNSIRCHKQRSNEQRRQECRLDLEFLTLRRETRWTETNRRCASEFPRAR